jgi:16S rRNA (guanine527-N7)-methyltransferase
MASRRRRSRSSLLICAARAAAPTPKHALPADPRLGTIRSSVSVEVAQVSLPRKDRCVSSCAMKASAPDLSADRARGLALTPVSPDSARRLDRFVALLLEWQQKVNLIADSTVPEIWTRHVADSLQLLPLAPHARRWIDLGSGAGFPGIPIACALADTPGATVDLIESNGKKAAFLREAVRISGVPALVHTQRIADFVATCEQSFEVVMARALAPVNQLLTHAEPLMAKGAIGLFLKGQDVEEELAQATTYWDIEASLVVSRTNASGRILVIQRAKRFKPG